MGLGSRIPLFLALTLFCVESSAADNMCVNGASEKNTKLISSFNNNRDPLKNEFVAACNDLSVPEKLMCEKDLFKKQFGMIAEVSNALQPKSRNVTIVKDSDASFPAPFIKKECIAASMKRSPGNQGFECDSKNKPRKYGQAGGKTLQCLNQDLVDYTYFAVNSAIQCMSPKTPIDSRVIFQKLNNETGFNHSMAWNGGVGAMQATSPAVRELTTPLGKGKYVLEEVAHSNKKSCQGFKQVAKNDLISPPSTNAANYCSWVSSGDGLARSLLHGIGYYITMRDQYVTPYLKKMSPSLVQNREVVNNLTAVSYGSEGIKHSRWLIRKFRAGKKPNAPVLLAGIQKNSTYLKAIKSKMREAYCLKNGLGTYSKACKNLKLSDKELGGDECVSN
jgi:hypothetical protein